MTIESRYNLQPPDHSDERQRQAHNQLWSIPWLFIFPSVFGLSMWGFTSSDVLGDDFVGPLAASFALSTGSSALATFILTRRR